MLKHFCFLDYGEGYAPLVAKESLCCVFTRNECLQLLHGLEALLAANGLLESDCILKAVP